VIGAEPAHLCSLDLQLGSALRVIAGPMALRRSAEIGEHPRRWQARAFRCGILAVMDRFGEAQAAATEGIRSAQQGRCHRRPDGDRLGHDHGVRPHPPAPW